MKARMEAIQEKINSLFDELVPAEGKADTVAGEIIRAFCKIGYRFFNDGDHIGVGYGKETCNPAARYLKEKAGEEATLVLSEIWGMEDENEYEEVLATLAETLIHYLEHHPELKQTENTEDMLDYYIEAEDRDDEEEEEYRSEERRVGKECH